ncbi:MAG: sigma-70 family RNA polymerase sigma factor [Ferruginibacter sp.]|nr:sigma-70 family RNA polymerase sigma factor [Cytophagales bacterium]
MHPHLSDLAAPLAANQWDTTPIQAFKNGNERALDEFYLLHRREFLRWSEKTFGLDATEALDIYQDAILILYENIRRNKLNQLNASLKTYFFGIGKHLILKKMSRQRNERRRWETWQEPEREESDWLEAEDPFAREERIEAVAAALSGLSERNRSILTLYYYHQLPLKTIAERLGYESVDVVKSQKVRCMKYLKKQLESQLSGKLAV